MGDAEPLLPPRAAARAGLDGPSRRAARGGRPLSGDQLRARARGRRRERRSAAATATRAWSRPGSRTRSGERQASLLQGQQITLKALVASWSTSRTRSPSMYVLNEDHVAIIVASTDARARAQRPLRSRRGGAVLLLLRERARSRALQPAAHARAPRHRPRPDGPLRGRLLVRRHRRRSHGRTGRRAGRRRASYAARRRSRREVQA